MISDSMKKVLVITGSRGEYGYIRPFLLRCKEKDSAITADVLATNMHLLECNGYTLDQFKQDGIDVKYKIDNTLRNDSDSSMVKSLFLFGLSLLDILDNNRYDAILLAGDRGEQLISSISGFFLNVPVFHIQAGERSGHVDGMTRHAIARFAHVHLAANEDASRRLSRFGEQEFRILTVGAPQLDEVFAVAKADSHHFLASLDLGREEEFYLFVYHPVHEDQEANKIACRVSLELLLEHKKKVIAVYPNSDSGSSAIISILDSASSPYIHRCRNLDRYTYLHVLKNSRAIIGNSSSGIIEAPVFNTTAINIGSRQSGRYRGSNVIDIPTQPSIIKKTIGSFISQVGPKAKDSRCLDSPYGSGTSTDQIYAVISEFVPNSKLLTKEVTL